MHYAHNILENESYNFFYNFVDCYKKDELGYKLYYVIVRSSYDVNSVYDCSAKCRQETTCRTFAFRY